VPDDPPRKRGRPPKARTHTVVEPGPGTAAAEFLLWVRLCAAARATNAKRPEALRRLARSIRGARSLTADDAAMLADILEGKGRPKGGRPPATELHRLVVDVYAVDRRFDPAKSDAELFRYLARIYWPIATDADGAPTRTVRLSSRQIRELIDAARKRASARRKPSA
jgi:hypothetical protein